MSAPDANPRMTEGLPATAPRHGRELVWALVVIAAVTALYAAASSQAGRVPAASSLIGHGIGVVGSTLMLLTAVLYPLRKLRTDARWGSTAAWLRAHMVAGLAGPYMVLLHSSFRFNGLAGFALLLTGVVVASGLVGRFLYTRVQRAPGAAGRRRALAAWHLVHLPLTWALFAAAMVHMIAALSFATLAP